MTSKLTAAAIEAAPLFSVFPGARQTTRRLAPYGNQRRWAIWETVGIDDDVATELALRGIPDPASFEIQRCDDTAPEDYSDTDAGLDALACGYTLVKLPRSLAVDDTTGRLFVLDPIVSDGWRVAVERADVRRLCEPLARHWAEQAAAIAATEPTRAREIYGWATQVCFDAGIGLVMRPEHARALAPFVRAEADAGPPAPPQSRRGPDETAHYRAGD